MTLWVAAPILYSSRDAEGSRKSARKGTKQRGKSNEETEHREIRMEGRF